MRLPVQLWPEAEVEFNEAIAFYEARRKGLGDVFVAAIHRTIEEIVDAPLAGALVRPDRSFHKRVVRRFPFIVVYKLMDDAIEVCAVMHTSRHPDSWIGRTRS